MNTIIILHFWHSTRQADHYIQMNQTGKFEMPVCRFRGKPYTFCSPNPQKPTSHDDFFLVGVGTEADLVIGPDLW